MWVRARWRQDAPETGAWSPTNGLEGEPVRSLAGAPGCADTDRAQPNIKAAPLPVVGVPGEGRT